MFNYLLHLIAPPAYAAASITLTDVKDASGAVISTPALTGVLNGIQEAAGTVSGSVNNQYLWTIAIMFIGFSFVIGLVAYLVKGHKGMATARYRAWNYRRHGSSNPKKRGSKFSNTRVSMSNGSAARIMRNYH